MSPICLTLESRSENCIPESVSNNAGICAAIAATSPVILLMPAALPLPVDKITIVSTGNGNSAGMNKITGDVAAMEAQIPALFETLSGMQFSDLLSKVKMIGDKAPRPDEKS